MTKEELEDEVSAIDAIYPGSVEEVGPSIYNFAVPNHECLKMQMTFPVEYPDDRPEVIQLLSTDQGRYVDLKYLEENIKGILERVYHQGEVVVFELFAEIEEFLEEYDASHADLAKSPTPPPEEPKLEESLSQLDLGSSMSPSEASPAPKSQSNSKYKIIDPLAGWVFSDPIVDRGSTFIGFARRVDSVEDAADYIDLLTTDKKVAKSNHNMTAWRIKKDNGVQYQDCDDDGETAAGGRILHLLTMMDVWNIVVVVSRWFGGTHIGPDRFKHINSAAREAVIKGDFLQSGDSKEKSDSNTKKKKK